MITKDNQGRATLIGSGSSIYRRQDSPKSYDIATVAYVTTPEFVKYNNSIWDGIVCTVEVPVHRAIDIDCYFDYCVAKLLLENPKMAKEIEAMK